MKWYLDSFPEKAGRERLPLSCPSGPWFVPRSSFDEPVEELPLPLTRHTIPKEGDFLSRQQWYHRIDFLVVLVLVSSLSFSLRIVINYSMDLSLLSFFVFLTC